MRLHIPVCICLLTSVAYTSRMTAQQPGLVMCVVPRDTSWRPVNFGFDTDNELRPRYRGVVERTYPIIRNVRAGSPADSAGIRDGDAMLAINGADLVRQHDSARVRGPGVPTRFRLRRGDRVFERTLTGLPAAPCPDSLRRAPRRPD